MNKFARLSLFAAAAIALTACGNKEEQPAADASAAAADTGGEVVVKIGQVSPMTGPIAHLGKDNEFGARLAIEDLNAEGVEIGGKKVKFELVSEDDQADPKIGTQVAQRLVDAQVVGVVGHLNSGTTIPASKIYSDAGIPQISPSATNPDYTKQGYKTTFRVIANDVQQGKALGEFAVDNLKAKKVAIIDDRTAYGQGLADEFEKSVKAAGGEVVKREFTNDKATDFAAIITSIKGSAPDVVFFGGADAQSAPMAKQMKRLGLKAPLVSGEMTKTPTFLKLAGKEAEGTIASLAGLPLEKMPKGGDYATRYKARFNADVATYSPYGYDATRVIIAAMKEADSIKPADYLPKLAAINYSGVTSAAWSYDQNGDLKDGGITVYKVEGGEWKVMETVGGAGAAAAPAASAAQ